MADANGNLGSNYVYDEYNRLLRPGAAASATPQYAYNVVYNTGGQRPWRGSASPAMDEIAH